MKIATLLINGGTIDSNGFNITIGANIDSQPDLFGGP